MHQVTAAIANLLFLSYRETKTLERALTSVHKGRFQGEEQSRIYNDIDLCAVVMVERSDRNNLKQKLKAAYGGAHAQQL